MFESQNVPILNTLALYVAVAVISRDLQLHDTPKPQGDDPDLHPVRLAAQGQETATSSEHVYPFSATGDIGNCQFNTSYSEETGERISLTLEPQ